MTITDEEIFRFAGYAAIAIAVVLYFWHFAVYEQNYHLLLIIDYRALTWGIGGVLLWLYSDFLQLKRRLEPRL